MGYDQRSVLDHGLRFDLSKEAEFCAMVATMTSAEDDPKSFSEALYRFSFYAEVKDDGTVTMLDLEWMSGDGWDFEVFDAIAHVAEAGDHIEMRHIDGYTGDVDDFRAVFDGAGGWTLESGRVVFD